MPRTTATLSGAETDITEITEEDLRKMGVRPMHIQRCMQAIETMKASRRVLGRLPTLPYVCSRVACAMPRIRSDQRTVVLTAVPHAHEFPTQRRERRGTARPV